MKHLVKKWRLNSLYSRSVISSFFSCLILVGIIMAVLHVNQGELGVEHVIWLLVIGLIICMLTATFAVRSYKNNLQALQVSLLNLQDGEFNVTIAAAQDDEFALLNQQINKVSQALRQQRQNIYHRELLLDKVNQNSPLAMLLFDQQQRLIYSNLSARHWLNNGISQDGSLFTELSSNWPKTVVQAINNGQDGLFVLNPQDNQAEVSANQYKDESQTWHLSTGDFQLNGAQHKLFLFKQLTREFNRQEVSVWKKVIRVISHEINNSIAPISSMTHSGKLLVEQQGDEKLNLIFNTIDKRIKHLSEFIAGYAKFARLPEPKKQSIDWQGFIKNLQQHLDFSYQISAPAKQLARLKVDTSQFEQLLINLIKNAYEAGSEPQDIQLLLESEVSQQAVIISVQDRGKGMNEQELHNALIPFYSTKQQGSGLGLALCREIVEAHSGQLNLHNRIGGGLSVNIRLTLE